MGRGISVVVLIKNEVNMLPLVMPCYASLQTALREVIFVDDGSTDGSKEKAHEIASRFVHMPIIWLEHEMRQWDEQRNIGLDAATGDFILSLDADMGFTGNLVWLLDKGYFDSADVWDFQLLYCRGDQFHYDPASGDRWNWTTRMIKNCGVRYVGEAHEQPTAYAGPCRTEIPIKNDGDRPHKGRCPDVWLFEWSYLLPDDDLLMERGRRLFKWRELMIGHGISPRSPEQYRNFARSDAPTKEINAKIVSMIPTMETALKHWGKMSSPDWPGRKATESAEDFAKGKMSPLLQQMRGFWYNNEDGPFMLDGVPITRKQIQVYGGPTPALNDCPMCQSLEWRSRLEQANRFQDHQCPTGAKEICANLCSKQGDDLWTNCHQNFWYAAGCDPDLNAPRACLFLDYAGLYGRYWTYNCNFWITSMRRALAQAGTLETRQPSDTPIDWGRYDWLWTMAQGYSFKEGRPPLSIVMVGVDVNHGNIQQMLDIEPDILLTSYPSTFRDNFRISNKTRVVFGSRTQSTFFARPNLGEKKYDLLVIGAIGHPLYVHRQQLTEQIRPLAGRYTIGFSHRTGGVDRSHFGPVQYKEGQEVVNYLNKWSEFLGSARFVTFGPMATIAKEYITNKVYESLGSGAIPILPEVRDFSLLGIEPMVHYIPLTQIWRNNARLEELLNNYDQYKHIAENAMRWHQENVDRMLFDDFENLIHELLGGRYPKRLL